jgi:cytochrome c-type biogenesis protein CcmH
MIDNSTQTLFWICSCGLMLILSVIVIAPWLRHKNEKITQSKPQTNLVHLNISIFKERLAELEADYQRKVIETDEYLEQKIDLERQLLAAHMGVINPINRHAESLQSSTNVSRSVRVMLVLTLMFLSFSAYYFWNQHQQVQHRALLDFWANQNQYAEDADALMVGKLSQPSRHASNHPFELLQAMQVNAYRHPFDANRWVNLSEAYMSANAIEPALAALAHAYRLKPKNNDIAMTYAQMRFFSLQGKMDSVTRSIVARILAQNPEHEGALLLMSMATYHDQHYIDSIYWLQRLKRVRLARATLNQPVNPAIIQQLDQTIHDAEVANVKLKQSLSNSSVMIDLHIAHAMKSKLHARDTVFVFIRALQGSHTPYAVQKISAAVLIDAMAHDGAALTVTLSDANSMLPDRTISLARSASTPLVVEARISQHHDPIGSRGDLESLPVPISLDAVHERHYVVNIDQIRP